MAVTIYRDQQLLKLNIENSSIPLDTNTGQFTLNLSGGSGSGNYHWSISPVSGLATTTSGSMNLETTLPQATFKFEEAGYIMIKVYKDGSDISESECYIQSKTLQFELNLLNAIIYINVYPETVTHPVGYTEYDYVHLDFQIRHPGLTNSDYNNLFSTKPYLYMSYQIMDETFYRYDMLSKATSLSGYSNGVKYIKNDDGTWTLRGSPSGTSSYNLILYDTFAPNFLIPNRYYYFKPSADIYPAELVFKIYYNNGDNLSFNLSNDRMIPVPEYYNDATISGLVVSLTTSSAIDKTFSIHIYDTQSHVFDNNVTGTYTVSAAGGVLNKDSTIYKKYDTSIKYKSGNLVFEDNVKYKLNTHYSSTRLSLSGLMFQYNPLVDIIFTVKANPGCYFEDGWTTETTYKPFSESGTNIHSPWDDWWVNNDVELCLGLNGPTNPVSYSYDFYFSSFYGSIENKANLPFCRLSSKSTSDGEHLVEGTYWIKMPASVVDFYCDSNEFFNEDFSSFAWPYAFVRYSSTDNPSNYSEVILRDAAYANAMKFCYYSKEYYFHDDDHSYEKILESPYEYSTNTNARMLFYRFLPAPFWNLSRFLTRRDLITSLRRLGLKHYKYSDENSWTLYEASTIGPKVIAQHPSEYMDTKAFDINEPQATASYFAGYPLGITNTSSWRAYNIHYPADRTSIRYTEYSDTRPYVALDNLDNMYTYNLEESTYWSLANSDFIASARNITDFAWGAWSGFIRHPDKWISTNFNPYGEISFHEAFQSLWSYAKFQQLDIQNDLTYNPPSGISSDFLADPCCLWALSRGFTTGFHAAMSTIVQEYVSGSIVEVRYDIPDNLPIKPDDKVDRCEWAYVLQQFCKYAWINSNV